MRLGVWPITLVAILALLMFAVIYWQATYVSGTELDTHHWEQRRFSFRRDPFSGIQFTPIEHNSPFSTGWWTSLSNPNRRSLPSAIGKHLRKTTYLPQRWDLIRLENDSSPGAAASILVNLLEAQDHNYYPFWPLWSADHPSRAGVIWPTAQLLVEFNLYDKLPALMDLALLENSSNQLTNAVGQLVQSALLEYCQQQQIQTDSSRVRLAAEVGLTYGDHPQLQMVLEASP